ncbi:PT domain-containing protein [Rothia koreensis]
MPCGARAAVCHPSVQRSTRRPAAQRSTRHPTVQPSNRPTVQPSDRPTTQHPAAHDPRPLGPVAKPRRRIPARWP